MNKRAEILETTMALCHERGMDVSLTEISEAVGCSKTLIIHYFETKAELHLECFKRIHKEIMTLMGCVEHVRNLDDHLIALWRTYLRYMMDNPSKAHFFLQFHCRNIHGQSKYKTPELMILSILYEAHGLKDHDPVLDLKIAYAIAVANGLTMRLVAGRVVDDDTVREYEKLMLEGMSVIGVQ